MLRIIHAADIHLDSAFSGISDSKKMAIRREDMRASFSKIIETAKNADFLFIAGDLFDGALVTRTTLDFLKQQFAKISDTPVFICAGNHDAYAEESVYNSFDFGENVHIFGTNAECIETEKADIYGISFSGTNVEASLLPRFTVKNPEKINILVMHGNLAGEGYNPIRMQEIADSGMDYIALGHIHKASGLQNAGGTYFAYPGCPEGRGFDETGEKGVLALELEKGKVQATFVPVQERMYIEEQVDISGAVTYEEIAEKIKTVLCGANHIYRIVLCGAAAFPVDTAVLKEKIEAFSVTVRDATKPEIDIEAQSREFSLKGLFAAYALKEQDTTDQEIFDLAYQTGIAFIEKEERNENR